MSEQHQQHQRAFPTMGMPFNPEVTRAIADASLSAWMRISQQLLGHTINTLGNQVELGRRMASARSLGEFLDAQAELGHRTVQTALECGRRIAEAGQSMTSEVTDRVSTTVKVAAETTAQQARVTEEQFRATSDQTRNAMKAAARQADEAVARTQENMAQAGQRTAQTAESAARDQGKRAGAH